jgi:methionine salvage enolase-phosphatase E1
MIIHSRLIDESKTSVCLKNIDGFFWVLVFKNGKLVHENRHLYQEVAVDEADKLYHYWKTHE